MNKYIILHNDNSKESRDFVTANPSYQVINWYSDSESVQEYKGLNIQGPSTFPAVADTENKILVSEFADMADALSKIDVLLQKKIEDENKELFIQAGLAQMIRGQRILAYIGATVDGLENADVGAINQAFASITMLLLTGSCNTAKSIIESVDITGTGLTEQNRLDILEQFNL